MKTTTEITVRNFHIDSFGHVNHSRYLEFLEEARWHYLEQNNLIRKLHAAKLPHSVVEINIKYKKSARIGEKLVIETEVGGRSDSIFRITQKIFYKKTGELIAEAKIINAFLNNNGRVRPLDDEILSIWPDLAAAEISSTGVQNKHE